MNDIIIRKVCENDVQELERLYENVWPEVKFDKKAKAEFVVKKSEGVSYCAEDNGRIVGSRTSFYVNMYYGTRPLQCVQCGDSCVDSAYRGKGLFLKMNKAFLKDYFQTGDLIYNISVYASKKAYEKLGWHYIESLMLLRKICRPFHTLQKIKGDIRKLGGDIEWDLNQLEFSIDDELLEKREKILSNQLSLHVRYNGDIIRWRQKSYSGIRCLKIDGVGAMIYKKGKRERLNVIEIGEIFLKDYCPSNFKEMMKEIKKRLSPDIIMVMVSLGHPLFSYYKKSGFWHNPRQKYLYHGTRVETEEMKKIAENPLNWAISSLDIDTF